MIRKKKSWEKFDFHFAKFQIKSFDLQILIIQKNIESMKFFGQVDSFADNRGLPKSKRFFYKKKSAIKKNINSNNYYLQNDWYLK